MQFTCIMCLKYFKVTVHYIDLPAYNVLLLTFSSTTEYAILFFNVIIDL